MLDVLTAENQQLRSNGDLHFDDMYCPDYSCSDILKSIIAEIKSGKVAIEDVAYLDAGMSKIAHMESYEDYGSPFCVMNWERYKG